MNIGDGGGHGEQGVGPHDLVLIHQGGAHLELRHRTVRSTRIYPVSLNQNELNWIFLTKAVRKKVNRIYAFNMIELWVGSICSFILVHPIALFNFLLKLAILKSSSPVYQQKWRKTSLSTLFENDPSVKGFTS